MPAAIDTTSGRVACAMRRQRFAHLAHHLRLHRRAPTCRRASRLRRRCPNRRARRNRAPALRAARRTGSATRMRRGHAPRATRPPIRLRAMLPPPMKAMVSFVCGSLASRGARRRTGRVPMRTIVAPSRDGQFEVVAHAHRQRVDRRMPGGAARRTARACARKAARRRADVRDAARESPSVRAARAAVAAAMRIGQRAACRPAGSHACWPRRRCSPASARSAAARSAGRMAGERRHQLRPVHGLHPVEGLRGRARLVRLQVADQVPFQSRSAEAADCLACASCT